jgi:putative FmdB family regulatory protein
MPLYEYRCAECGQVTQVLEKMNASRRHTCGKCGSARMEKLVSSFSVGGGPSSPGGSCPTGTCPLS